MAISSYEKRAHLIKINKATFIRHHFNIYLYDDLMTLEI